MNTQTSIPQVPPLENRRSGERREEDRRRSTRGLFELRARRDRVSEDRRQSQRRTTGSRLAFWRRRSD